MRVRGGRFARRQKRQVENWWAQEEDLWAQSEFRATLLLRRSQALRTARTVQRRLTGSARPLIVCFVVTRPTTWRLDRLYWLLDQSANYEPFFLVSRLEEDTTRSVFSDCTAFAREQGYRQAPVDPSLGGLVSRDWLEQVDAVFYDIPYDDMHADERLTSENFPYAFLGYLPYGVRHLTVDYVDWSSPTVRRCDRYYCETHWHRQYNIDRAPLVGRRSVVTGYPSTFRILQNSRGARERAARSAKWALPPVPKVLWAPHWTWAASPAAAWRFLAYHQLLCNLARQGRIELWYRPHPLLDVRLKGMAPTQFGADAKAFPRDMPYQDATAMDYVDLFAEVDLIVHNSGSFLSEFIATGKPAVFITEESFIQSNLGDYGKRAMAASYQVASASQLEDVLDALLNERLDGLAPDRLEFAGYLDEEMPVDPCEVIAADLERVFRMPL